MVNPIPFVIFQPKAKIEKKTNINIVKRRVMEQTIPAELTGTGFWNTIVNKNQGKGNL